MCLVRKLTSDSRRSRGGLILPDCAQDGMEMAEVVDVGPGLVNEETGKRILPDVEPGETVLLPRHSMHDNAQISIGGEKLFLVPAPEICASVESDEKAAKSCSVGVGIGVNR